MLEMTDYEQIEQIIQQTHTVLSHCFLHTHSRPGAHGFIIRPCMHTHTHTHTHKHTHTNTHKHFTGFLLSYTGSVVEDKTMKGSEGEREQETKRERARDK